MAARKHLTLEHSPIAETDISLRPKGERGYPAGFKPSIEPQRQPDVFLSLAMSFTRSFAGDRERKAVGLGSRGRKLRGSSEKRRWGKSVGTGRGAQGKPEQVIQPGGKEERTTGDGEETACLQEAAKGKRTWEGAGLEARLPRAIPSRAGRLTCDLGQPSAASVSSSSAFHPFPRPVGACALETPRPNPRGGRAGSVREKKGKKKKSQRDPVCSGQFPLLLPLPLLPKSRRGKCAAL